MKKFYFIAVGLCCTLSLYAQRFPAGHYCNSESGWNTKACKAVYGMKSEDKDKVIVVPHRGFWGAPGIPETSLAALQVAYDANYMFCEIDLILTKDKVLILCHDQQPNRLTNAPPTFSADGGVEDPGNFFRSLNYKTTTDNSVPDANGNIYKTFPAIKDLCYRDRFGNVTPYRINTFDNALDFCVNKDIVLELDIKVTKMSDPIRKEEYLEAMRLTLSSAKQRNLLHKVIFKPGSAGKIPLSDVRNYLSKYNLWEDFANKTNVILIEIIGGKVPENYRAFIDEWLALPSLIGVEYIYKTLEDPLLVPRADFDNKSVVQYTKDKGIKTGVFHPMPTDKSGSHSGRGTYYNPPNHGVLDDLRGSLEFLFGVPKQVYPGILVTDRPDVDMDFLELFDLNSRYSKRDF